MHIKVALKRAHIPFTKQGRMITIDQDAVSMRGYDVSSLSNTTFNGRDLILRDVLGYSRRAPDLNKFTFNGYRFNVPGIDKYIAVFTNVKYNIDMAEMLNYTRDSYANLAAASRSRERNRNTRSYTNIEEVLGIGDSYHRTSNLTNIHDVEVRPPEAPRDITYSLRYTRNED